MSQKRIADSTLLKLARRGKGHQINTKYSAISYFTNNGIIYRVDWDPTQHISKTANIDTHIPFIGY